MAPIVNEYFRFKSLDEIEKYEEDFNKNMEQEDVDDFKDDVDASELFG